MVLNEFNIIMISLAKTFQFCKLWNS